MSDKVEEIAKLVYEAMRFERKDSTPKWVDGGNSFSQDEARAVASRIDDLLAAWT